MGEGGPRNLSFWQNKATGTDRWEKGREEFELLAKQSHREDQQKFNSNINVLT
jgi:hypothetical protein